MTLFITSCGRHDLLKRTLESFFKNQSYPVDRVVIHEDAKDANVEALTQISVEFNAEVIYTNGIGQHASIEKFLYNNPDKYYVHCEDDWEFDNSYDWITCSMAILENDSETLKVLCRKGSPHKCVHSNAFFKFNKNAKPEDIAKSEKFGILLPWKNEGITWYGFSWNPGVTSARLLRQMMPFPKWEQDLSYRIFDHGFRIAELEQGVYTHIGEGRSTHE